LSQVLGREIVHKRLTNDEESAIFNSMGMPVNFARSLNGIEQDAAGGSEERAFRSEKAIIGKEKLEDYSEANKQLWARAVDLYYCKDQEGRHVTRTKVIIC